MKTKFKVHGRGKNAYVLIPATRGLLIAVSPKDVKRVIKHSWFTLISVYKKVNSAGTRINGHQIQLGRFIMRVQHGDKRTVDHWNRNVLDNRRCNLRVCSRANNARNEGRPNRGYVPYSKFRGVVKTTGITGAKNGCRFHATASHNGIRHYLGIHRTQKAAARAHDKFVREKYGKFAVFNFPRKNEQPPKPPPEVKRMIAQCTSRFIGRRKRKSRYIGVHQYCKIGWEWTSQYAKIHKEQHCGFSSELAAAKAREKFIIEHNWPNQRNFKKRGKA